jgi:hypothetical protein
MSIFVHWLARLYAPLRTRGALIEGSSIRASLPLGGSESRAPDSACTPFAQPRGRARVSAPARHAHEGRGTLAA